MLSDFKYCQEAQAMKALENNVHFTQLLNTFHVFYADLTSFAQMKGRNFLITKQTNPRIYRLYRTAAERLGVDAEVPIYAKLEHRLCAETVGTDEECAIVLSSACIEHFNNEQLLAILAHELTHILYGHVKYLNMGTLVDVLLQKLPLIGTMAGMMIKSLLLTWRQYAEYTADRGAAIAAWDIEPVMSNLSQAMGACLTGFAIKSDYNHIIESKKVFINNMTKIGQLVFQTMIENIPQPFGILRMIELKAWYNSGQCKKDFSYVYYGSICEFGLQDYTDAKALYRQAQAIISRDQSVGMALLHASARQKESDAMAYLAKCYMIGKYELSKNDTVGLAYLREAALLGNPNAQYGLGVCLKKGWGSILYADPFMSDRLFQLAAESGHKAALEQAEKYNFELPVLENKMLSAILNWFVKAFSDGNCIVNKSCPLDGLLDSNFDNCEALRSFLWISRENPVYAAEIIMEHNQIKEAIAVAGTGIYLYRRSGLPLLIPWSELKKGRLEGLQTSRHIKLRWNGSYMWDYVKEGKLRCIGKLIIRLKTAIEKL